MNLLRKVKSCINKAVKLTLSLTVAFLTTAAIGQELETGVTALDSINGLM